MITVIMAWNISFYSEKVEVDTLALPPGILANLLRTMEMVEQFGPNLGRPHTAPLDNGIFEIRAKGREGIARTIFCTIKGQELVVLLTTVKKTNALPKRQMDIVHKRMKEVQNND